VFVVCAVSAVLYFWSRSYLKNKAAELNKVEAYNQKKGAISAIIYPVVGLALIGVMLFNWNRIPPENTGLAIGFMVFAAVLILYGFVRWYRTRNGNQD
jgi:Na+/H+ antiporter NhaC